MKNKEKKIYYSDLTTLVDVCYSCKSQNIIQPTELGIQAKSFCDDCKSEDVGAVFPEELL
jgi:hypothetical protein